MLMVPSHACIQTINGDSSSIKFALFQVETSLQLVLEGRIEQTGMLAPNFVGKA